MSFNYCQNWLNVGILEVDYLCRMKCKSRLFFIGLIVLNILFNSCKKTGSLTIQFKPRAGGQNFVLNQAYKNSEGKNFEIERLKFYISDLNIIVSGKSFLLSEIALLDASKPSSLEFRFNDFDDVTITKLEFGMGVKAALNNPTKNNSYDLGQFVASNPLSASQNMYWSMTNDYRFFMLEGKSDTSATQNASLDPTKYRSFLYHIGKDKFFTSILVDAKSFRLEQGKENRLIVNFDLEKVFASNSDTINMATEFYTEAMTLQQEDLAQRMMDNIKNAFSVE